MKTKLFLLSTLLVLAFVSVRADETADSPFAPRLVEVGEGYSKTSVNTTVFRTNSIVTHADKQYIAYYDRDGYVTLGRRTLGQSQWQILRTDYRGHVEDAHNIISIMVDGDGYLHISFDHHNAPLNYCRSIAPDTLALGPLEPMIGSSEEDVTYPEFYRLASGDLLFVYRSGGSGRGNLVMNHYDLSSRRWERVQDILIDGQDERNAYWQMCVDEQGTIHLSWVWRETWLVETNHDLCYARSSDNGKTWQRTDGSTYSLPIRLDNAEYACHIPQESELINQTSMTTDSEGHPYIATYWRDADSDVPQYRLVWHDGHEWHSTQVSHRTTPFSLSGGGTKMIPIARPRLVVEGNEAMYIFRDEERGSHASMYYTDNISSPEWKVTDLTSFPVDAWEPSLDTELWKTHKQLHIFLQHSTQGDGEQTTDAQAQPVYVLEVNPANTLQPTAQDVRATIKKVNAYWQSTHPAEDSPFWDVAAYHTGNMEAYFLTSDSTYYDYSLRWADYNKWMGARSNDPTEWKYSYGETDEYVLFGDFQTCFQTYADLYTLQPEEYKIARARQVMEYEMSTPNNDYWWWADALYMVMPVMVKLHKITGNPLYLDKLSAYWHYADSIMYDPDVHLYYRDARYVYPEHKTINGKKDFWARGDGWVLAALAKVLKDIPFDSKYRQEFLDRYLSMAEAVASCQQPEGYWTRSMIDADFVPGPETSGTAFFTYALMWGINNGYLSRERFLPVVLRAWDYLSHVALQPDGRVGYVQPIGDKAIPGQVVDKNSTHNFGVGAFLLAACEIVRFLEREEAYLFVYFTGNRKPFEAVHYAVSTSGLNFHALNHNRPVLSSEEISLTGGVRDPHILRGVDGQTFYMVLTDMVSSLGWDSNRGLVLLRSTDLIHWTHSAINIQNRFEGQSELRRVWAPQTIFDPQAGKYMVYWSMKHGKKGADIIYYAYANDDFTDFVSDPRPLFLPQDGKSCIDGDIVYKDGTYYLFYKTEGHGNGIKMATTHSLTSGEWTESPTYKQQTMYDVEGAGTFRRIDNGNYVLMYDVYKQHKYQFTETADLEHYRVIDDQVTMDFNPRHGTILPITLTELSRLLDYYGTPDDL